MVTIPPGTFLMGSARGGVDSDEGPVHEVSISRVFRMSETEITNLQYEQFRPEHKALRDEVKQLMNTFLLFMRASRY